MCFCQFESFENNSNNAYMKGQQEQFIFAIKP